jgi:hypothetical protein
MLTEQQLYENKHKYVELLTKLGVDLTDFSKFLDSVDYFNKPASTNYFRAYQGGLCQYALDLYYELCQLANAYFPGKYTEEDVIKVALFKDLYRAILYEECDKNAIVDGKWQAVKGYRYKEDRPTFGDMGFSSYMVAKHFFDFTDEQIEAITQADSKEQYAGDIHDIMRSYPLVTLTKMADLVATYLEAN